MTSVTNRQGSNITISNFNIITFASDFSSLFPSFYPSILISFRPSFIHSLLSSSIRCFLASFLLSYHSQQQQLQSALHRASKICLLGQREGRPLRSEQIAVVVAVSDKKEGRKQGSNEWMKTIMNE